jgi:hypothetical protein
MRENKKIKRFTINDSRGANDKIRTTNSKEDLFLLLMVVVIPKKAFITLLFQQIVF